MNPDEFEREELEVIRREFREQLKKELAEAVGLIEAVEWKTTSQYLDKFKPTKPSIGKGDEVFMRYMKLFDKVSVNNPLYGHLTLHLILGQIFKHIYIYVGQNLRDLRIHPFVIQDSGSGKSVAESLVIKIANSLGIPIYNATGEVSEPKLIGSWEWVDKVKKVKAGGKVKPIVVREKVLVPGVLKMFEKGGIILYDEAGVFLRSAKKEYNLLLLNYIQAVMNPIGSPMNRISRDLKGGQIIVQPQCSLWFLTYPIKGEIIEVLRTGFFQRTLPLIRRLSEDDWKMIEDGVINLMLTAQNKEEEFKKFLKENERELNYIISYLREVKEWAKNVKRVYFGDGVKEALNLYRQMLYKELENLEGEVKEIFNTFRVRSLIDVMVIAAHKALLDKRIIVRKEDVEYAAKLIFNSITSLIKSLEFMKEMAEDDVYMVRWRKLKSDWVNIIRRLKPDKQGWFERKKFVEEVSKYFKISIPSAYRYVQEWVARGLLEEDANKKMLKV